LIVQLKEATIKNSCQNMWSAKYWPTRFLTIAWLVQL